MTIPIYSAEASLAHLIKNNTVATYCSPVEKYKLDDSILIKLKAFAKQLSPSDILYPTMSVLVSTIWNGNDDVFPLEDSWNARHTPINMPDNIEHDEHAIVGHMVNTWVVDADGNVISDDTPLDKLPDSFHICNAAVIYKVFQSKILQDRVNKLIEQIEANQKYVSMECRFNNFDYAIIDGNGNMGVVARNDSTSFLTKHLRAYGGSGEFDGNKIGRLLRSFVFSGKGYVDVPANPASIILHEGHKFSFSKSNLCDIMRLSPNKSADLNTLTFNTNAGVYLNSVNANDFKEKEENGFMAKTTEDLLQEQLNKTEAALAQVNENLRKISDEKVVLETELAANANVRTENAELKAKVEASEQAQVDIQKKYDDALARIEKLEKQISDLSTTNSTLEQKIADAEAAQVTANRVHTLISGGMDKTVAEETVEKFKNLNEEQFSVIAEALLSKVQASVVETEQEDEEDVAEASVTEDVLEEVETEDEVAASADTNDEDEVATVQASLAATIRNFVSSNKEEK